METETVPIWLNESFFYILLSIVYIRNTYTEIQILVDWKQP